MQEIKISNNSTIYKDMKSPIQSRKHSMTIVAFSSRAADQLNSATTYPTNAVELQSAKLQ